MISLRPRLILFLTVAILAGGLLWSQLVKNVIERNTPPQAEYLPTGPIPDFTLTESHGQTVRRADLMGKVWVADLIFTSCGDACPLLSAKMSHLDHLLGSRNDVRLVSITVTPEYDQPPVLREYAERFHASDKWLFLTGERAQIVKLANDGFWLSAGTPGTVTHSEKFVLIDRTGSVRGFFDSKDAESMKHLVETIGKLTQP